MKCSGLLAVSLLFAGSLQAQSAEAAKGLRPYSAALHVHSRYSNGEYDISELAAYARSRNIDVLGVTDSFLTRVRFGIPPFRKLFSRTFSRPGVLDHGLDAYFASFAETRQQFDDLILLPGLEVAPYYYWQGRWPGQLDLYDFDRHVLIFGVNDQDALRHLPVIENAGWSNSEPSISRMAGPFVMLLSGVLLVSIGRIIKGGRLYRLTTLLLLAVAAMWAYDAYPYGRQPDAYSGKPDFAAFQRLFDYVDARGGVAFWSYPEARYPDVQASGARMISKARPESLGLTDRYRGFEGLYGDNITITAPGNLWDHILLEYTGRGRSTWPSVISGIDFHSFKTGNAWYQLDGGITVLFAAGKSEAAMVEALKLGRGYATFQRDPKRRLGLADFALRADGQSAIAGETLQAAGTVDLTARIDWMRNELPPAIEEAAISIVLDGQEVDAYRAALPADLRRRDTLQPGRHYYRIKIDFAGSQILSNPIFCNIRG